MAGADPLGLVVVTGMPGKHLKRPNAMERCRNVSVHVVSITVLHTAAVVHIAQSFIKDESIVQIAAYIMFTLSCGCQ